MVGNIYVRTHRQQDDFINLLYFFQNRKSRLKTRKPLNQNRESRVSVFNHWAMKTYWEVEDKLRALLTSLVGGSISQLQAPVALAPITGMCAKEKNNHLLHFQRIKPPFLGHPALRLVTMSTELSRLRCTET
jgi:hypothetical protein